MEKNIFIEENWPLVDILRNFCDTLPDITAEQLENITDEERQQLLLEKADYLFRGGRYNPNSEVALEMFDSESAKQSWNSFSQMAELNSEDFAKFKFFKELQRFCYPLFRKQTFDLTLAPFNLSNNNFSILNEELLNWLYETKYVFLAHVICEAIINTYKNDKEILDTIAVYDMGLVMANLNVEDDFNTLKVRIDGIADRIYEIANHLEIGKRLGLTPRAQAMYDMHDTFVCKQYDYRQIDFVKEMDEWLEKEFGEDTDLICTEHEEVMEKYESLMEKYNLRYMDEDLTKNYLLGDLFCEPIDEEDEYLFDS